MRLLLIALAAFSLMAAEEDFLLADGRTFTGIYDAESGRLWFDHGKAAITVAPEQIKERCPAKPKPEADKPAIKTISPEEKAERNAKIAQAQKERKAEILRCEGEQIRLSIKDDIGRIERAKGIADRLAESFKQRAIKEGENYTIQEIKARPIALDKTTFNNGEVLNWLKEAARIEALIKERKDVMQAKFDESNRLLGIEPAPPHEFSERE